MLCRRVIFDRSAAGRMHFVPAECDRSSDEAAREPRYSSVVPDFSIPRSASSHRSLLSSRLLERLQKLEVGGGHHQEMVTNRLKQSTKPWTGRAGWTREGRKVCGGFVTLYRCLQSIAAGTKAVSIKCFASRCSCSFVCPQTDGLTDEGRE